MNLKIVRVPIPNWRCQNVNIVYKLIDTVGYGTYG